MKFERKNQILIDFSSQTLTAEMDFIESQSCHFTVKGSERLVHEIHMIHMILGFCIELLFLYSFIL